MTSGEAPAGVGETALGAAMMRAEESTRRDRLFDDRYAAAFVAAAPDAFADGPDPGDPEIAALAAAFQENIAVRTRFYDDYLVQACGDGCEQVVLVAAGLDTRAFRLDWPSDVRLFELDLPEVLSFKERVLTEQRAEARCARVTVGVDLRDDWPTALVASGFDVDRRSAWTAEGLLTYLTHDDAVRLLTRITDLSRSGSQLALETARLADDATLAKARATTSLSEVSALWEGGLHDDPARFLREKAWDVTEHDRAKLATSYNRNLFDSSTAGYLTAIRRS